MKVSLKMSRAGGDPSYWMSRPLWVLFEWITAQRELCEQENPPKEGE
ncbi:hypothetical protein M3625_14885 [Paenibacillus sp. MER 78]|nr:hypothetical protein [Paenibacillus sp. MER 78]